MFKIDSINSLFSRPILEALIEKRKVENSPEDHERAVFKKRSQNENREKSRPTDDNYIFDLPGRQDIFGTDKYDELLNRASDVQEVQYARAQFLLSNLGLIPRIRSSRRINMNKSNRAKINKIKDMFVNLFDSIGLDEDAPAAILKGLLNYTKADVDNAVGYNTFDYLNKKGDWNSVLSGLKKRIAGSIAGLENRAVNYAKNTAEYMDWLNNTERNRDKGESPSTLGDAAQMYGEEAEPYESPANKPMTIEEKEKLFLKAYNILFPLYTAASQSGMSPAQYLKFQQSLDKVAGALRTNNIRKNLTELEAQKMPRTIGDYKDILIEALAKSVTGTDEMWHVSNYFGKEATRSLHWLERHMKREGFGSFNIENILKYIREGTDKRAVDTRYWLEELYDIKPEELNTDNYPTFGAFVQDLYKKDSGVYDAYKYIHKKVIPTRTNLKDTSKPLHTERHGGMGNAIDDVLQGKRGMKQAREKRLAKFDEMTEHLEKLFTMAKDWNDNKATMDIKVPADKSGLGTDKKSIALDFGEMDRQTITNVLKGGSAGNSLEKYVTEPYKEEYRKLYDENNTLINDKISAYVREYKIQGFGRKISADKFRYLSPFGPTKGNSEIDPETWAKIQNKNTSPEKVIELFKTVVRPRFVEAIAEIDKEISAKRGETYKPQVNDLNQLSDEEPSDDINNDPYIAFEIIDSTPRFINLAIKELKKIFSRYDATINWDFMENDFEEKGYLMIYYPENGQFYKLDAKTAKAVVGKIQTMLEDWADNMGISPEINLYGYEFASTKFDSSGIELSEDEEDVVEVDDNDESADIESEFMDEDEEIMEASLGYMNSAYYQYTNRTPERHLTNRERYPNMLKQEAERQGWEYRF